MCLLLFGGGGAAFVLLLLLLLLDFVVCRQHCRRCNRNQSLSLTVLLSSPSFLHHRHDKRNKAEASLPTKHTHTLSQPTRTTKNNKNVLFPNHSGQKRPTGQSLVGRALGRQETRSSPNFQYRHCPIGRKHCPSHRTPRPEGEWTFVVGRRSHLFPASQVRLDGLSRSHGQDQNGLSQYQ